MPGHDYAALIHRIDGLVKGPTPVAAAMNELIAQCAQAMPHGDWPSFAGLAFADDVDRLQSWLETLLSREPPGTEIDGLWFGLFNPIYDGDHPTADLYAAGGHYDPSDPEWMCDLAWFPNGRYAQSQVLGDIYRLAYQDPDHGLGNDAEFPLCLAYAGLAVRTLAERIGETLRGGATRRGLTVGFDSGDWLCVGTLTEAGFHPSKDSQTLDPWPTSQGSSPHRPGKQ